MSIDELITKANQGIPSAQNTLGVSYMIGDGIPENPQKGAFWLKKAADAKFPPAMSNYGMCLLLSQGVAKDTAQGLDYIKEAYMYGDNEAVHKVLSAIDAKALDINDVVQLADTNTNAMFILSLCLRNGVGCDASEENFMYGHSLLVKACEHKNPAALFFAANGALSLADTNHDLLIAKTYFTEAMLQSKEYGYVNPTLRSCLHQLYQQLEEKSPALLVKIISHCKEKEKPEDQYLQDMLDGKLYMKTIAQFNSLISNDESSKNNFRGDSSEGTLISPHIKDYNIPQNQIKMGCIDDVATQKKVYCITALDFSTKHHAFFPISHDMRQFGKYAVIIREPGEFLKRLNAAFEQCCHNNNAKYELQYGRVMYDVGGYSLEYFNEFHKTPEYAWQNEFRITLDFSEGKFPLKTWENMTNFAKATTASPLILDTNPLSTADSIYFEIGDIRDICTVLTIDELLNGSFSDIGSITPIPLPSSISK